MAKPRWKKLIASIQKISHYSFEKQINKTIYFCKRSSVLNPLHDRPFLLVLVLQPPMLVWWLWFAPVSRYPFLLQFSLKQTAHSPDGESSGAYSCPGSKPAPPFKATHRHTQWHTNAKTNHNHIIIWIFRS